MPFAETTLASVQHASNALIFFDEGKAIHGFTGGADGAAPNGCVRLSTFRLVERQFNYDTTMLVR
jgi:hypothetical protein